MGWAYAGTDYFGRQIGYGIEATCDMRNCNFIINRGLGCICGDMHHGPFSDEPGCGGYYCTDHQGWVGPRGGCHHRQKERYGLTLCQLMTGEDVPVIFCACGLWKYEGEDIPEPFGPIGALEDEKETAGAETARKTGWDEHFEQRTRTLPYSVRKHVDPEGKAWRLRAAI